MRLWQACQHRFGAVVPNVQHHEHAGVAGASDRAHLRINHEVVPPRGNVEEDETDAQDGQVGTMTALEVLTPVPPWTGQSTNQLRHLLTLVPKRDNS